MKCQDIPRALDDPAADIPDAVISLSAPPAVPSARDQAAAAAATAALMSKMIPQTLPVKIEKDAGSKPSAEPLRIESPIVRDRGTVTYSHRGARHVATYEVAGLSMTLICGLGTFKVPSGQGDMQKFARNLLMSICKRAHKGDTR